MAQQLVFGLLTLIALGGAVGVVVARSVFVSALWLVLSFVGVAGMYALMGASFLAAIQILIYVGAISVLILFAVMLTRNVMAEENVANSSWVIGLVVALITFGMLTVIGFSTQWPLSEGAVVPGDGAPVVTAETTAADGSALSEAEAEALPGAYREDGQIVVAGPIAALGRAFMNEYLLAFETISVVLLVALVGAIVIARD